MRLDENEMRERENLYAKSAATIADTIAALPGPNPYLSEAKRAFEQASALTAQSRNCTDDRQHHAIARCAETYSEVASAFFDAAIANDADRSRRTALN